MKKILILFLLNLLIPTVGFSQSTYPKILQDSLIVITNNQLKTTNLIFLEHRKFKTEIALKDSIITQLQFKNDNLNKIELLRINQIQNCNDTLLVREKTIETLNKSLSKNKIKTKWLTGLTIGGFSISTVLLTLLLLR